MKQTRKSRTPGLLIKQLAYSIVTFTYICPLATNCGLAHWAFLGIYQPFLQAKYFCKNASGWKG